MTGKETTSPALETRSHDLPNRKRGLYTPELPPGFNFILLISFFPERRQRTTNRIAPIHGLDSARGVSLFEEGEDAEEAQQRRAGERAAAAAARGR